jgi:hypothetical protein
VEAGTVHPRKDGTAVTNQDEFLIAERISDHLQDAADVVVAGAGAAGCG